VLFPDGRVSEVQRRQMTTVLSPNVHAVAVEGTFDDCQDLVKAAFADAAFRDEVRLSAVNSINWARVMAQIVYYVTAHLEVAPRRRTRVSFVVPTGNFGNILAGWAAKQMGLPVDRLVVASNRNDILTRFFTTGTMEIRGVVPTTSPSMDIQVSSNLERLLFETLGPRRRGDRRADGRFRTDGTVSVDLEVLDRAAGRVRLRPRGRRVRCRGHPPHPRPHRDADRPAHRDRVVHRGVAPGDPSVPVVALATAHPRSSPTRSRRPPASGRPCRSTSPTCSSGPSGSSTWRASCTRWSPWCAPGSPSADTRARLSPMKYVICVPDGCADEPHPDLGGRTPLEVADMPVLQALAARGTVGRAAVIPEGMAPGSDVGNLSILGYDPALHHTGRAPIEAAALGIRIRPDQVAFRCNLSTVDVPTVSGQPGPSADELASGATVGTMADFAGGHPSSEDAAEVVRALDAELGSGAGADISFHPGVQYRHVMVAPESWAAAECVPPHDLSDKPALWPTGPAGRQLCEVMLASREVLARFDSVAANQVWLWGQGHQPQLPSFRDSHGVDAGMVTAVDLVRGLGVLTGMEVVEVEGATGWYDTNYEGKRDAAVAALRDGADLFVIHIEATDEAGHAGDVAEKVRALENWDRRVFADLVPALDAMGEWRMLVTPDHPTPLHLKTHTTDTVPYLLVDSSDDGPGGEYTERGTAASEVVPGHELMSRLLARD
jgi:2,3-bisphosphoglycerate-independent phosphoglycerate mutase